MKYKNTHIQDLDMDLYMMKQSALHFDNLATEELKKDYLIRNRAKIIERMQRIRNSMESLV